MNRAKELATYCPKLDGGPGGWHCRCCRPGPIGWSKRYFNRNVRRKVKLDIKKEALSYDTND